MQPLLNELIKYDRRKDQMIYLLLASKIRLE
jgi:hypothetical protein